MKIPRFPNPFTLLTLGGLLLSSVAGATTYPWVRFDAQDVQFYDSAEVEVALRAEIIGRAKKTLDIITYDQRFKDQAGLNLLLAVKAAAMRGVKVRFLTSWFQTTVEDSSHVSAAILLLDPQVAKNVEYRIAGGFSWGKHGWKITDAIHEKIILVDGKWVVTSGRGHGDIYRKWIDTGAVMRGPLVQQTIDAFEKTWAVVGRVKADPNEDPSLSSIGKARQRLLKADTDGVLPTLQGDDASRFAQIKSWLDQEGPALPTREVRGRTLHRDLIVKLEELGRVMKREPRDFSMRERIFRIPDPVINAMTARMADAKSTLFTTLSYHPLPALRIAMANAIKAGKRVEVITNGLSAYKTLMPIPLPWLSSMEFLIGGDHDGVKIYEFQDQKALELHYIHRKVAIIDDTVIYGSHNFNSASTFTNDELSYEFQDREYAETFRRNLEFVRDRYSTPVDISQVRTNLKTWLPMRHLFQAFMPYF